MKLINWLYKHVAQEWCGNDSVPLNHEAIRFIDQNGCSRVVTFSNDAFEIGIGNEERWDTFFRREDFNKVIRWYLYNVFVVEWFGIRRKLYYWLLFKKVSQFRERFSVNGKLEDLRVKHKDTDDQGRCIDCMMDKERASH